jgi:hypothetical protein
MALKTETELVECKVYRYKNSGKLIASLGSRYGTYNSYVIDLGKDLRFLNGTPHRVNQNTQLEKTKWIVEVEYTRNPEGFSCRLVRSYPDDITFEFDITDSDKPLEKESTFHPVDTSIPSSINI